MELRQLRYLASIVECGSITRASQRLYVAQSALSQQLAKLEAELNTTLLHRTSSGISLTGAGRRFYEQAVAILRQVDDVKKSFDDGPDTPVGTVVLGLPQSVSSALALPLFVAAKKRLPKVTLLLTEELTGNLEDQLGDGRLDLAILFDDGTANRFNHRTLAREKMYLLGAADCCNDTSPIPLVEALRQPLILPSYPHGVRHQIERLAQAHRKLEPNVIAEINSVTILGSALIAGLGMTILPQAPLQDLVADGRLAAREIVDPTVHRTLCLCSAAGASLTRAGDAVSRLVGEVVADLCAAGTWHGTTAARC